MIEACLTADEWRMVVASRFPDARPEEYLTRADGALFFRLIGDADGPRAGFYRAAFLPAHSYGYVEAPR